MGGGSHWPPANTDLGDRAWVAPAHPRLRGAGHASFTPYVPLKQWPHLPVLPCCRLWAPPVFFPHPQSNSSGPTARAELHTCVQPRGAGCCSLTPGNILKV